ncbi:hypothetical protein [Acetitomaculum ruminis]|nr:hypothetical protein [Acetitomaculum ruminis]
MYWKNLIKKHKKLWSALLSFVACVLCVTILAGAVLNSSIAVPDNPIASIDDSHLVKLSGKTEVMTENNEDSVNSDDEKEDDKKDDQDKGADDSKDSEQTTAAGNGKSNNKTAGEGKDDNEYFTTSIEDKTIVYEDEYEFTVTQLREDVKLNSVMVVLNGGKKSAFTGKVTLKKGENTIQVICNYTGSDPKPFNVKSKVYTVNYEKPEHYFKTDINDGGNIYNPKFDFTITQLYPKVFKLKKITVTTNDGEGKKWEAKDRSSGSVDLKKGDNTIKVVCEYEDKHGKTFEDSQEYHQEYDDTNSGGDDPENNGIKIWGLDSGDSYKKDFEFTIHATKDKKPIKAKAYVVEGKSKKLLEGSGNKVDGYTYKIKLGNANDTTNILLIAGGETKNCEITYKLRQINWNTENTEDKTVTESTYSFKASANWNDQAVSSFTVTLKKADGSTVELDKNQKTSSYVAELAMGENTITCTATLEKNDDYDSVTETKEFKITRVEGNNDVPEEGAPTLNCNLSDRPVENGAIQAQQENLSFIVTAKDSKEEWITNAVTIQSSCNYQRKWLNVDQASYDLYLNEGYNTVTITVTDSLNRSSSLSYSINYTPSDAEKPLGKATIKAEATTIGLGLIFSENVEYYKEDTVASKVHELLQENGYSPIANNAGGANYYLKGISGTNGAPLGTPNIPKDLEAKMLELNESDPSIYHPDPSPVYSLSEFDFSSGSGWMYEISYDGGKSYFYPNYSMGAAELQNGCIVRLRFTLYYGCDIGGAASPANGGNQKGGLTNWEKEW